MRKSIGIVVAAAVAGCGASVQTPPGGGGGGAGGSDQICTQGCAGTFTLDSTGFIVGGQQWWTTSSGPELRGTIDSPYGTLQAYVDDVAVGDPAVVSGTSWTLQLPSGAIGANGTTIALHLTAPGAEVVEHDQRFVLYDGKPAITTDSKIHDELGDTISFATGDAVHTHAGALVDLAASGCPRVDKYAYLTDVQPAHATETSPNPLAWRVAAASPVGIDTAATSYRVRTSASNVVLDWTLVALDPDNLYTIALHRDGAHPIAQLGSYDGPLYVDVQARDVAGNANVATYCISYHPLAAPLEIQPLAAEPAMANSWSIWQLRLPADNPVSNVLNVGAAPRVIGQRLVQHAGEVIDLDVVLAAPTGQFAKTVADHYIETTSGTLDCGTLETYSTDQRCKTLTTTTNTDTPSSGAIASGEWSMTVIDEATGAAASACTTSGLHATCSIPARAPGGAPHAYRVVASFDHVMDLWPANLTNSAIGEYSVAGRTFTGYLVDSVSRCNTRTTRTINTVIHYECAYGTYTHFMALGSAALAFDPFHIQLGAGVGGSVPRDALAPQTSAAMVWDAGTDVLPGQ